MHDRDPTKRIPKSLGTETKLFGNYTLTDLAVGLLPGVLVVLATQVLAPPGLSVAGYTVTTLTLPVAGAAVILGALFVYLTPAYTTSIGWLATFIGFHRGRKQIAPEQTRLYTRIERAYPRRGVIGRADGALVGVVQVEPPAMALATDAEWAAKAEAFRDFLNTAVEFPIQLYSTTQRFPVEAYLERYERRLDDPDVKANPRLAALIEHYVDWYAGELDERRMTIRDHYVIVPVAPAEVQFEQESLTQQLAKLPVIGSLIEAVLAPRAIAEFEAMASELDERLRNVELGLREIDGCSARRVSVREASQLVAEFWAGEPLGYGDVELALRTRPLVGGPR